MLFGFAAIVAWILLYFSSRFRPSAAAAKASCGDDSFSPGTSASVSRYEFSAGKGVSGFVEEPRAVSFVVQEMMAVDSGGTSPLVGKDALIHEQLEYSAEEEDEDEDGLDQYFDAETFQDTKLIEEGDCQFEPSVHAEDEGLEVREEEQKLSSGGDASRLESRGGLSGEAGLEDKVLGEEDPPSHESWISSDCGEGVASVNQNSALVMDQPNQSDDDDGYIELELPELQKDTSLDKLGKSGFEQLQEEESTSESDSLWEHEDIVEQLKLELRNVRTGGLTTILEESESESKSPRYEASGGLKPMKIVDKTENKDRIRDIQKVYKSYSERMKKLDVLNYQTLHAIGLIQLRGNFSGRCSAGAVATSLIPDYHSRKSRLRRRQVDPVMESIGAYYQELEMVYVGHVCLSWEILQWQYIKAQELLESGSACSRSAEQYNQVTSELQLFRVLLQRFLEDEPFRGSSRVENYARTRCILRSLLQVPAVKDDCFKDKKARVRDEDAVSAASLLSQIEESMKVFLDFLRRDKHEDNTVHGGLKPSWADNQQRLDADLTTSLRTQLQKKERRLKETLRIEGCITKKFRRKKDGDGGRQGHSMLVAQVDLRLVSRVLKARRLTRDQADWCREKIARISFAGGKITVEEEPSFLLFPC